MQGNLKRLFTLLLVLVMLLGIMLPVTFASDTTVASTAETTAETESETEPVIYAEVVDTNMTDASVFADKTPSERRLAFIELVESQVGESGSVYEEWWDSFDEDAASADWGTLFVGYCLYNVGVLDFPFESNWADYVDVLTEIYEDGGEQYYYPITEHGPSNYGDIVVFDTDFDGVPDDGGVVTEISADISLTVTKRVGDVVDVCVFDNLDTVMGVMPIEMVVRATSGIMLLNSGSGGSGTGSAGGGASGSGNGTGSGATGPGTLYWAAPAITFQIVLYPYSQHNNWKNSYENIEGIIERDNYKVYDAVTGNTSAKSVYDGFTLTPNTFYMDLITGRVYKCRTLTIEGSGSGTKGYGYIDNLSYRGGNGFNGRLVAGTDECVSGWPTITENKSDVTLQSGNKVWTNIKTDMPNMNEVEQFMQKVFIGYGSAKWDVYDVATTSSQYAQVLRYLGCPEQYITNYLDGYNGKLDFSSNALIPTLTWTYCEIECTGTDYLGVGTANCGWSSISGSDCPSWFHGSKLQHAYFDYDSHVSCGCSSAGSYHTSGNGTSSHYGSYVTTERNYSSTEGNKRWHYQVMTPGWVGTKSMGETAFNNYFKTAYASPSADLNAYTNASGGSCKCSAGPSVACALFYGNGHGAGHYWPVGNYFGAHIAGAGYVNFIAKDGKAVGSDIVSDSQYYFRGYWTPYGDPVKFPENVYKYGTGNFKKVAANGSNADLAGWVFTVYSDSACTKVANTGVTDTNGVVKTYNSLRGNVVTLELLPGTYYVKETGHVDYTKYAADGSMVNDGVWGSEYIYNDPNVTGGNKATVVIEANKTANLTITNTFGGKIALYKTTNTGANLDGWKFTVYTDSACTKVATYINGGNAVLTTDSKGYAKSGILKPGTYYVKETGGTYYGNGYWVNTTAVKQVTVKAKSTTTISSGTFPNNVYGLIKINKSTNTGSNKDGWVFTVYTDANCATVAKDKDGNNAVMTTDSNGTATSGYLAPGTYYVKETGGANYSSEWWDCDASVQSVTVSAMTTTTLPYTYMNYNYGKLSVTKSTNTGANLDGWVFTVYTDANCTTVAKDKNGNNATMTTDSNGTATSDYLLPGTYYVKETGGSHADDSWASSADVKSVIVVAGVITPVDGGAFVNTQYGKLSLTKSTNTGNDLDNWTFTVYTDANCTTVAKDKSGNDVVMTTDSNGAATSDYLLPGTYYVKETGGTRYNDPYWVASFEVKSVTVVAGVITPVDGGAFVNTQYGRITILKEMATDGPLDGWNFTIYTDEACTHIATDKNGDNATMRTDANGAATSGYLLPGTYYVKEIIDEETGLYYCKTKNPVTVVVTAGTDTRAQSGEKTDVSFINALRPIEIEILKVDPSGNPLRDVTFMLEWYDTSDNTWKVVQYSDNTDVIKGCTSAAVNSNGELSTDANGRVLFGNLHPEYDYRITETATQSGYVLLKDPVVVKQTDVPMTVVAGDDSFTRHYAITVTNMPAFELTEAGVSDLTLNLFVGGGMFFGLLSVALFATYMLNRKKKHV